MTRGKEKWGRSPINPFFLLLVCSGLLAQQLPLDPVRDSGASVTGALEGWYKNPDGSHTILVGYFNRNLKQTLDIPAGPDNRIEPGGPDQGQPTHFLPRRQWGVFSVVVPRDFGNKRLTWTITANGQTTTVPLHLDPQWILTPFEDAGVGNTPPVIRFDAKGAAFTGPPRGFAQSLTAQVGEPLALNVWITDDGKQAPEARPRQGPPANIVWSKYRGVGDVAFENARPLVGADGKASTTVQFSAAGEYIIRGQSNDSTGDGGGGFQCCWTNIHVKVTVTR